ncbi:uncharacterized protein LOC122383972 [Amphibalanus amphitrite]|uniref:uncharacterized protein LOC122383972 n=1 Tax=Amphibalanus amphitrite TaxID=1232801 RepID=UPI001C917931|nr:uncharacterized protein LOC122383972 [Amphibalanus amphitrite]
MEWARLGPGKEADLNALMDFLAAEVERRERSGAFTKLLGTTQPARDVRAAGRSQPHKDVRPAGRNQPLGDCVRQARTPSGAALTASSGVCIFCGKAHRSVECHELLKLSVSQRHDLIKQSGACFRCLSGSHRARECQSKCELCGGGHHKLCCFSKGKTSQGRVAEPPGVSSSTCPKVSETRVSLSCNSGDDQCVVLPTARVLVHGAHGSVLATLLFDTGSDRTYVSEELVKKVGATWLGSESVSYAAFGGGKSTCERAVRGLRVSGANLSKPVECLLTAVEVPVICSPLQRPRVPRTALASFVGVELADSYSENREMSVDILVGLDVYWSLVQQGFIRCSEGSLVAQETSLGWIVSGVTSSGLCAAGSTSCQLLTLGDLHEDAVRNLWSLEGVGIRSDEEPASSKVLEDFESSVSFSDDRYDASRAVTEMQSNFYVDDFLSGADSEEEARSLLSEAQSVVADAGMCLAKCRSNSTLLFDNAVSGGEGQSIKVLD